MGGGLIQLVAYGVQDIYLTGDPQITFFKVVYKRHTNFSIEPIKQFFSSEIDFGKRVTCTIARHGDLINDIYIFIQLPFVSPFKGSDGQTLDPIKKFAWVKKIGYAIIKEINIEIGGQLIDTHYGDWLNIWSELTNYHDGLDTMIGNIKELTEFSNGKQGYGLYIPLEFWFCKDSGLALPLISLQYSEVKIHLELNNAEDTYIIGPTHNIQISNDIVGLEKGEYIEQIVNGQTVGAIYMDYDILTKTMYYIKVEDNEKAFSNEQNYVDVLTGNLVSTPIIGSKTNFEIYPDLTLGKEQKINNTIRDLTITSSWLVVNYIYLDTKERMRFAKSSHEFIIEQLQYAGSKTISGNSAVVHLGFNHPTKEIVWVAQLNNLKDGFLKEKFNYKNDFLIDERNNRGVNIIKNTTILLNGQKRFEDRRGNYFNWLVPYERHKRGASTGIYVYTFSLYPEQIQPSGSCNMSKIDDVIMNLEFDGTVSPANSVDLRVYMTNYNVFRIIYGLGGLVFSQ